MSVANMNAYALSQGITKTYDSMTQAEQTTLRYNYLMSVSKDAQGDFARTSDSFANQLRIASLNVKSLFADIGQLLIPVAQNAMKAFNDVAGKLREAFQSEEMKANIQAIAENVGKLVTKIAELIANNLPKMIEGLTWIMNNASTIAAGIVGIGTSLATLKVASTILTLVSAFQKAKAAEEGLTITTWLLKAATTALGGPWAIVIGVIVGVVAAIVALWNTNEDFRNAVIGAWNKIKEVASNVWNGIVDTLKAVVDWIKNNWQGLALLLVNPFVGGFKLLYDNCNGFKTFVNTFVQNIKQFFVNGWNAIVNFFTVSIPNMINSIINWFKQLPANIAYEMGYILASIISWGINTWTYLSTNVPVWIDNIKNWFKQLPGNIWDALVNVVNNIKIWGSNMYDSASSSASNTIDSIENWFKQLPDRVWNWLTNVVSEIGNWGSNMYDAASSAVGNVIDGIGNWFEQLPDRMRSIGTYIVAGLKQGISDAWDGLTGWIGDLCDNLTGGFAKGWDINSPSRVFRDFIGKNIVAGIQVGVDYEFPNLQKSVQGNVSELTSKMKSTVNYETARTTAGVVAQNNYTIQQANPNMATNSSNGKQLLEIHTHVDIDGKEVAYAVAPHQDVLDKYNEGR